MRTCVVVDYPGGGKLRFRRKLEGSLWILGSGPKSTIPEVEIRALILIFRPPWAGVKASILHGALYDLAPVFCKGGR
jgi:hypothetical protein